MVASMMALYLVDYGFGRQLAFQSDEMPGERKRPRDMKQDRFVLMSQSSTNILLAFSPALSQQP